MHNVLNFKKNKIQINPNIKKNKIPNAVINICLNFK